MVDDSLLLQRAQGRRFERVHSKANYRLQAGSSLSLIHIFMGTSTCHMVLGAEQRIVPGMCGVVEDGIIPGLFGYEAGQSCVGDHFAWFVENCVPGEYQREAERDGVNLHQTLEARAAQLRPGESGLLALDWWNGNRSVLVDVDLTGLLIGATLATKPEEIYRALIEATAVSYTHLDVYKRQKLPPRYKRR